MIKEVYEAPKAEITVFELEEAIAASNGTTDFFGIIGSDETWGD